jgi:plastocyanin
MARHGWTLVGLTVVIGLLGAHAHAGAPTTVGIEEFKFTPAVVTVRVGATVRWVNHDEEPHTVTSTRGAFASTGLVNGDTFAQSFTRPGRYQYFCALHPIMRATVVVK